MAPKACSKAFGSNERQGAHPDRPPTVLGESGHLGQTIPCSFRPAHLAGWLRKRLFFVANQPLLFPNHPQMIVVWIVLEIVVVGLIGFWATRFL